MLGVKKGCLLEGEKTRDPVSVEMSAQAKQLDRRKSWAMKRALKSEQEMEFQLEKSSAIAMA